MSSSGGNTNPCPFCGRPKTSWSAKCQLCEGDRQRYIAASSRTETDEQFLVRLRGRTLASVAKELGVSRQRVHQIKRDAERRVAFLQQPPTPILQQMSPA